MIDVPLLYSRFFSRTSVRDENYGSVGHAIDRFVDAIDQRFSCTSLLNRDCGSLVETRNTWEKVLIRKNIPYVLEAHPVESAS